MKRFLLIISLLVAMAAHADVPETVAVTYRFTNAHEPALRAVIEQHWATAQKMKLVSGERHLYRGNGFFLEIFTWRDESIPDSAPAEIRKLWDEMQRLTDNRDGTSGITFEEIHEVRKAAE